MDKDLKKVKIDHSVKIKDGIMIGLFALALMFGILFPMDSPTGFSVIENSQPITGTNDISLAFDTIPDMRVEAGAHVHYQIDVPDHITLTDDTNLFNITDNSIDFTPLAPGIHNVWIIAKSKDSYYYQNVRIEIVE